MKKYLPLSMFWLTIIALISMTIDHLGIFLDFSGLYSNVDVIYFMRIIGRIAFILYAFFIVQGVLYTSSFWKYMGRLGMLGLIMFIVDVFVFYRISSPFAGTNIFITLIAGAMLVYYFHEQQYKHVYLLLPALYLLILDLFNIFTNLSIPNYISGMYGFYGVIVISGFYGAYLLARRYINNLVEARYSEDLLVEQKYFQMSYNALASLTLLLISIILFIISIVWPKADLVNYSIQGWGLLATIPIMLYNGELGYNKKWWKIFTYAYYPSHLLIFGIIILLLN